MLHRSSQPAGLVGTFRRSMLVPYRVTVCKLLSESNGTSAQRTFDGKRLFRGARRRLVRLQTVQFAALNRSRKLVCTNFDLLRLSADDQ